MKVDIHGVKKSFNKEVGGQPMKLQPGSWGLATWQDINSDLVFAIETRDVVPGRTIVKAYKDRQAICLAQLKLVGERRTEEGAVLDYSGSIVELRKSFDVHIQGFVSGARLEIGQFDELLPTIVDGWEEMLGLQVSQPTRPVRAKITLDGAAPTSD